MILGLTGFLFLLAVLLWTRWRRKKFSVFKNLGIPGPEPSFLFGNALEMALKNPVDCQNQWVRKYGGVLGYYFGSWPTVLVSDPILIKQVLIKDFSAFVDRPREFLAAEVDKPEDPAGQNIFNTSGTKWKEVRSLITPCFTAGKLKQMIPILKDSVNFMVSKLEKASCNGTKDVEIGLLYKCLTMDAISKTTLGVETSVQENPKHPLLKISQLLLAVEFSSFLNLISLSFREFGLILKPLRKLAFALYNKGSNPLEEMFFRLGSIVKAREANPSARRPDLLQTLINARADKKDIPLTSLAASADNSEVETMEKELKNDHLSKHQLKLTDDEVQANALGFFFAGYETTSTALIFLTHYLVNHQSIQDKVRQEIMDLFGKNEEIEYDQLMKMHYTDLVISESLRMNPPVHSFCNRVASRDVQIAGWKIPAGMTVQIPLHYVHFDSENFDNAKTFNPERFLPENRGKNHSVTYLPFGAGPRNCVGMRFALLEIKMALVAMLKRFKLEPCGKSEIGDVALRYLFITCYPKNGVHVRAVPINQ